MTTIGTKAPLCLALLATGALLALTACTSTAGGPVQASSPAPSPTTSASPTPSPSAGSESGAKPTASATVGAVVEGFPTALLPLMPGATVVSSSFDESATPATAALVASIAGQPADIMAFYTAAIEAQGFKAVPGESVGGVASKDFVRGTNETINLAIVEVAGTSTFTLGANVAPESIK